MNVLDSRKNGTSRFTVFTALLAALATAGVALSIATTVHLYGNSTTPGRDDFYLAALGTLAAILGLSIVSWMRRGTELRQRHSVEGTLRESEQKYRVLVENAPVGIVISSFDGAVIDVNDTLGRMHGYGSKDEFIKSSVSDRFEDLKERDRWVGEVWDAGKVNGFEVRAKRKDGSVFWTSTTAVPRTTETGEQQIVAVVQDITERKKAESALAESEAKFRILAEQSPNMIFIYQRGRVVYANRKCTETMGYSLDEFYAASFSFLSMVKETSRAAVVANLETHRQGREVAPYEYTLVAKDGTNIDCILMSRLVEFRGEPAIMGTVTDITQRKQAERAMAFKNALLEAQSETTEEGIIVVDENGKIVLHNRRFRELWGIPEEVLRQADEGPALNYVLPKIKNPEAFMDRIRYLQTHVDERGSDQIELKDGTIFERYSSPLVEANGTYRGRVRYFRDVTEARNAGKKLEHAAEEWRRTFDSIQDAVSIQDAEFRLVRVNKAYARMVKMEFRDLLGKKCYEVMHKCNCPLGGCPHQLTLNSGESGREEFFEPSLGLYLEVTTSPISDENGKTVGSVHVARDVTARRQMEKSSCGSAFDPLMPSSQPTGQGVTPKPDQAS